MEISNVILHNKSLSLYIKKVKPFIDDYKKRNGKLPCWDVLDVQFKNDVPTTGIRRWFYELVRRYNTQFKDALHEKVNNNYNEKIGSTLNERYLAIEIDSPKNGKSRSQSFSEQETEALLELL